MRCGASSVPAGRSTLRADRNDAAGAVTAELAVALPAVVLVLAASLGGLGLGLAHLRAQDAAADAARMLGRGESVSDAAAIVARGVPGARLATSTDGDLVCARVELEHRLLGVHIGVSARSCALDGGR